ncbi:MAG: STAS domain-containing protein [Calditrichia bacterium]
MKIKESFDKNIAVLALTGNMMGGPDTTALHQKVKSLLDDGIKKIVIDMKGVKWMNSSGLGVLMACSSSIAQAEGELKLSSVAEKVNSVLMITKMVEFFDTYETSDRAVGTFKESD